MSRGRRGCRRRRRRLALTCRRRGRRRRWWRWRRFVPGRLGASLCRSFSLGLLARSLLALAPCQLATWSAPSWRRRFVLLLLLHKWQVPTEIKFAGLELHRRVCCAHGLDAVIFIRLWWCRGRRGIWLGGLWLGCLAGRLGCLAGRLGCLAGRLGHLGLGSWARRGRHLLAAEFSSAQLLELCARGGVCGSLVSVHAPPVLAHHFARTHAWLQYPAYRPACGSCRQA